MASNDVSVPAALIFIDSLGSTLPFRNRFTFKELSDFCYREGVIGLSENGVSEPDLMKIAYLVEGITGGHVKIVAGPTPSGVRSPLSKIDLKIANRKAQNECKKCGEPSGVSLLCHGCTEEIEFKRQAKETPQVPQEPQFVEPMKLYAHATLEDGTEVHVVEIHGDRCTGVDDEFVAHEFRVNEVREFVNMDEPLIRLGSCNMCGEDLFDPICGNCGNEG